MTVKHWVEKSIERYHTESATVATKESAKYFALGALRRTVGRAVGTPVWDVGEWDILCILDAARVDLMREASSEYPWLPEGIDAYWSVGSCSPDWIDRTFSDPRQTTGYVTGNPFSGSPADWAGNQVAEDDLGYLDEVWRDELCVLENGITTVPPEVMTAHALSAWERRDDLGIDRLIVHYMQPHQPFRSQPDWAGGRRNLMDPVDPDEHYGACPWQLARRGEIDADELWTAYRDNLCWVLDDGVAPLVHDVNCRVGLSADHGNGRGEWGIWEHPPGAVNPQVRKVPYVEIEAEGIEFDGIEPVERTTKGRIENTEIDVNQRLEALGYR